MSDLHDYQEWLAERIDGTKHQITLIPQSKQGGKLSLVLDDLLTDLSASYVNISYYISTREGVQQVPQSTAAASASATHRRSE